MNEQQDTPLNGRVEALEEAVTQLQQAFARVEGALIYNRIYPAPTPQQAFPTQPAQPGVGTPVQPAYVPPPPPYQHIVSSCSCTVIPSGSVTHVPWATTTATSNFQL